MTERWNSAWDFNFNGMTKSEAAEKLYCLISDSIDCFGSGIRTKRELPDFSSFDVVAQEIPSETGMLQKDPINRISPSTTAGKIGGGKGKTLAMIEIAKEIVNCKACPLYKNSTNRIPGIGLVASDLFVVANPVTAKEERENHPLTEKERDFFSKWMLSIGVEPNKIFFTNILKCNFGNQQITINTIEACRTHLDRQIALVSPKVIITLGQLSFSSLKKSAANLQQEHGTPISYLGIPVFPLFDPATVLNNLSLKSIVWEDLKKLKLLLATEPR